VSDKVLKAMVAAAASAPAGPPLAAGPPATDADLLLVLLRKRTSARLKPGSDIKACKQEKPFK
jgi:hypothetical protein